MKKILLFIISIAIITTAVTYSNNRNNINILTNGIDMIDIDISLDESEMNLASNMDINGSNGNMTSAMLVLIPVTINLDGGNGDPSGEGEYSQNETVYIFAGTKSGYKFSYWSVDEGDIVLESAFFNLSSFVMGELPVVITAHWETAQLVTINLDGGDGDPSGEGYYAEGDFVYIQAGEKDRYSFSHWEVDVGDVILEDENENMTTFIMGEDPVIITAHWIPKLLVTVNLDGGDGDPSGEGYYAEDEVVYIQSGEKDRYKFSHWVVNFGGITLEDENDRITSFVMGELPVVITAHWTPKQLVTVNLDGGDGDPSGEGYYAEGEVVFVQAGEKDRYKFSHWEINEGDVILEDEDDSITTFIMGELPVIITAHWVPKQLVTVNLDGGNGDPSGEGYYAENEIVIINAGSKIGYDFSHWEIDEGNITLEDANESTTTFIMGENPVIITAQWKLYTVTVNLNGGNGNPSGEGEYASGDTVTINAGTREEEYRFSHWGIEYGIITLDDINSATTTFTMGDGSVIVSAHWGANVTVNLNGGDAETSGEGYYIKDDTVTIRAGTREGFVFSHWAVNSGGITLEDENNSTTTFLMGEIPVIITAHWLHRNYVTVNLNGGNGDPSGAGEYTVGETVTIRAGSREGFSFSHWSIDEGSATLVNNESNMTTFIMGETPITVTANWTSLQPVTVNLNGGNGNPSGEGDYARDDTVTINAGTRSGYRFSHWSVNAGDVTLQNPNDVITTFVMGGASVTVSANWISTPFVTINLNGGNGSPSGEGEYAHGETVIINAGLRTGYVFSHWSVESGGVALENEYNAMTTFIMDVSPVVIEANWRALVTVNLNGGNGSPSGTGDYAQGETVTLNSGVRENFRFSHWTVETGGVTISDINEFTTTFIMGANPVIISAHWISTPFVTINLDGGNGSPSGAGNYAPGEIVEIQAGSRSGFSFSHWVVNSGGITLANSIHNVTTFTMGASPVTITAHWILNTGNTIETAVASDGNLNWVRRNVPSGHTITRVVYDNEMLVAPRVARWDRPLAISSTDGITWASRGTGHSRHMNNAAFGNNQWMIVGDNNPLNCLCSTLSPSPNAVAHNVHLFNASWGSIGTTTIAANLNDVVFANGTWIAIAPNGIWRSSQASPLSFTQISFTAGNGLTNVTSVSHIEWAEHLNLFIMTTNNGVYRSTNGQTWTRCLPSQNTNRRPIGGQIAIAGDLIVINANGGQWLSLNAIDWVFSPSISMESIIFGNDEFAAISNGRMYVAQHNGVPLGIPVVRYPFGSGGDEGVQCIPEDTEMSYLNDNWQYEWNPFDIFCPATYNTLEPQMPTIRWHTLFGRDQRDENRDIRNEPYFTWEDYRTLQVAFWRAVGA
jgi:hypothetical protein